MGMKVSSVSTSSGSYDSREGYQNEQKENYIYPPMTTARSIWTNDFLDDGFLSKQSKGVHSIEAMKRTEESKSKPPEPSKIEKFKGFAYKDSNIEPFEKTFVSF